MSAPKERPILFSAPMVRALLDGSKTQTRRIVKPGKDHRVGCELAAHELAGEVNGGDYINCPYGEPGDRLWVRETFVQGWDYDPVTDRIRQFDYHGKQLPIKTWYRADGGDIGWCDADGWQANTPWKPSIHMPRWASRITLEITGIHVERLRDISDADALAEGIDAKEALHTLSSIRTEDISGPRAEYSVLWESINGPGSWDKNPWVWVIEFRRLL